MAFVFFYHNEWGSSVPVHASQPDFRLVVLQFHQEFILFVFKLHFDNHYQ